jgi:hypothetical protein
MSSYSASASFYSRSGFSAATSIGAGSPDDLSKKYSGIVINQNDYTDSYTGTRVTQEFKFPSDYARGDKVPRLTGLQVYTRTNKKNAAIKYRIYRYDDSLAARQFVYNKIVAISHAGGKVQYTTAYDHDMKVGDKVTVTGSDVSGYNGTFIITDIDIGYRWFKVTNATTTTPTKFGWIANVKVKSVQPDTKHPAVQYHGQKYYRAGFVHKSHLHEIIVDFKNKKSLNVNLTFNQKIEKFPSGTYVVMHFKNNPASIFFTNHKNYFEFARSSKFSSVAVLTNKIQKINYQQHQKYTSIKLDPATGKFADIWKTRHFSSNATKNIYFYKKNIEYYNDETQKIFSGGTYTLLDNKLFLGFEFWVPDNRKGKVVYNSIAPTVEEYEPTDENYDSPRGWISVAEGVVDSGNIVGDQWVDIKFASTEISPAWLGQKFKFVIESDGIDQIYYKSPNAVADCRAYKSDLSQTINDKSFDIAFRIMGGTTDEGVDFLTNQFRHVVTKSDIDSVIDSGSNAFWSSKPNPSKYGVESIYFDVSNTANAAVSIDSVYLDPITPGVNFNVYYSNDDTGPGHNNDSWEKLLWTWVPKTYTALKKQSYVLPRPINAKYIKIEFSRLQADYYNPGDHDKPILYNKFPSWVVNYFLSIQNLSNNATYDPIIKSQSTLRYDTLDLAFNYYRGDILNYPSRPVVVEYNPTQSNSVVNLLQNAATELDSYDGASLANINAAFDQFRNHPGYNASNETVVGKQATLNAIRDYFNYSTEQLMKSYGTTAIVSHPDRNHLLDEKQVPDMYFAPTCKHGYMQSWAKFENSKAYFVKVKEIRFERSNHNIISDKNIYQFSPGGVVNYEVNHFISGDDSWTLT